MHHGRDLVLMTIEAAAVHNWASSDWQASAEGEEEARQWDGCSRIDPDTRSSRRCCPTAAVAVAAEVAAQAGMPVEVRTLQWTLLERSQVLQYRQEAVHHLCQWGLARWARVHVHWQRCSAFQCRISMLTTCSLQAAVADGRAPCSLRGQAEDRERDCGMTLMIEGGREPWRSRGQIIIKVSGHRPSAKLDVQVRGCTLVILTGTVSLECSTE